MLIEVRDLAHRYPTGTLALDHVNLGMDGGEVLAIIGQNGSGKTTLVKHLNGLLRPTDGAVCLNGEDIRERPISELARTVGFAFQNPDDQIFRGSVLEEVSFGPENIGFERAELTEAVDAALEATGLSSYRADHPYTLSPALRKLVSIAGVYAMRSAVLVLDEPTTGQDLKGVRRIERLIESARSRGTTVIVVTHDMAFVARNFGRVVVMADAHVLDDGPPATVFWNLDALVAAGLEAPAVARLSQQLEGPPFLTIADAELRLKSRFSAEAGRHSGEERRQ